MFERYTEDARRALFFARYEASQFGSVTIDPEHLLLGLLRLKESPASPFLARLPDIRSGLAKGKATISTSVEIPFSPASRRVLQVAAREADGLQHGHIGAEHLLLGLLADPSTVAGELLAASGLQLEAVRQQIAATPVSDRPGPLSFAAADSPQRQRQAALQQLDAAVTFMRNFADRHAQTDEARGAVEQICRDILRLKSHLPEG